MPVHVPLTGVTTLTATAVMGYGWLYLGRQLRNPNKSTGRPVRLMHKFFLYMAIFSAIISVPYLWTDNPSRFSTSAAWSYVVGHIFAYLAFMYIARMAIALIPRLSSYDKLMTTIWYIAIVFQTAFNAKTMIWGVQPTYDYKLHLTEFHTYTGVGIVIGVMALFSLVPAVILFAVSAMKARGIGRIKPALLSLGLFLVTTGGPLHDNARSAQQYALADVLSILGMTVALVGIAFHIQSNLVETKPKRTNVRAPSNTV